MCLWWWVENSKRRGFLRSFCWTFLQGFSCWAFRLLSFLHTPSTSVNYSRGRKQRNHFLDQLLLVQPLQWKRYRQIFWCQEFTVKMFCLFSVPSTQVMRRRRRSMTAEVAMCVSSRPVNPCFSLMYSMTCKHVYWYEYQFCTSRAKTTVRSQFTIWRQQTETTWIVHSFCAPRPGLSKLLMLKMAKLRHAECLACIKLIPSPIYWKFT